MGRMGGRNSRVDRMMHTSDELRMSITESEDIVTHHRAKKQKETSMKTKLLLISTLFLVLFAACQSPQRKAVGCISGDCTNGYGVFILENGSRYEGEFLEGIRTGQGKLIWADGREYTGEFMDNQPHGSGVLIQPDGSRYEGDFREGKLSGNGTLWFSDGRIYVGEFENNIRHGSGRMIFEDGTVLDAIYMNGIRVK
ncbi:MAG: hypothetical protein EA382_06810 [Spirochaetaceae bacterium]|nr:MAG: hypothetical protein EA382_06810 [Spirochaetaceae bacterium]